MNRQSSSSSPSDVWVGHFAETAKIACVFELRVRMLADSTSDLSARAFKDLTGLLDDVLAHYAQALSEEEQQTLRACAYVRNKLLHQELSRVTGKLVSLGEQLESGSVVMGRLAGGFVQQVSQTSTATGRIYGWLLESYRSGAFGAAQKLFLSGNEILERLF